MRKVMPVNSWLSRIGRTLGLPSYPVSPFRSSTGRFPHEISYAQTVRKYYTRIRAAIPNMQPMPLFTQNLFVAHCVENGFYYDNGSKDVWLFYSGPTYEHYATCIRNPLNDDPVTYKHYRVEYGAVSMGLMRCYWIDDIPDRQSAESFSSTLQEHIRTA